MFNLNNRLKRFYSTDRRLIPTIHDPIQSRVIGGCKNPFYNHTLDDPANPTPIISVISDVSVEIKDERLS